MRCERCKKEPDNTYLAHFPLPGGKLDTMLCWDCLEHWGLWCHVHQQIHGLSGPYGTACIACVEEAVRDYEDPHTLWDGVKALVSEEEWEDFLESAETAGMITGTTDARSGIRFLLCHAYMRRIRPACVLDLIQKEGVSVVLPHPLGLSLLQPPAVPVPLEVYWQRITDSSLWNWIEPRAGAIAPSAGYRSERQRVVVADGLSHLDIGGSLRSFLLRHQPAKEWVLNQVSNEVGVALLFWFGTTEGQAYLKRCMQEVEGNNELLRTILLATWVDSNAEGKLLYEVLNGKNGLPLYDISEEAYHVSCDVIEWLGSIAGIWYINHILSWKQLVDYA